MNASRARRRWLRWCRYVDKTQSLPSNPHIGNVHDGQALAYEDLMYARRAFPRGVRIPYYPRWATVKR